MRGLLSFYLITLFIDSTLLPRIEVNFTSLVPRITYSTPFVHGNWATCQSLSTAAVLNDGLHVLSSSCISAYQI